MSTASEAKAPSARTAPRLVLPPAPPAAPASRLRPWSRLPWLLGVVLLTVSLVGATHVLHSRPTEPSGPDSKVPAERGFPDGPGVVCEGTVAVEGMPPEGVPLMPIQPGQVTEVLAYAGQAVHKGDILLRVHDEYFQQKLAEAEIGVRVAEGDLAKAQRGQEQYRHGVEAQRAAVEAAKHKVEAARATQHRLEGLQQKQMANADEVATARETAQAYQASVAAEEANLRRLEASRPDIEVEQATQGVARAKLLRDQARTALENCVLRAPSDGTVLRLNISQGMVIGPQLRQVPVQFAPAGPRIVRVEVPQEFAHRVQRGMAALVYDRINTQFTWRGTVKDVADAYLPRRGAVPEMLSLGGGDAWMLECTVELAPGAAPPRLFQRVRVSIGTHTEP